MGVISSCTEKKTPELSHQTSDIEKKSVDSEFNKVFISSTTDDPKVYPSFNVFNYSFINASTNYDLTANVSGDSANYTIGSVETPKIIEIMMFGDREKTRFYNPRIFVQPGDSISMQIRNGRIKFQGKNADQYNFFSEMDTLNLEWPSFKGDINTYKKEVEAIYRGKKDFFDDYIRRNNVSKTFENLVGSELKFEYLFNLVAPRSGVGEGVSNNYNVTGGLDKALSLSSYNSDNLFDLSAYFDEVTIEDFQKPELINNDYFKRSLSSFIRYYFANQGNVYYSREALEEEINFVNKNFSGAIRDYALGKIIYDYFENNYNFSSEESEHLLALIQEYKENTTLAEPSRQVIDEIFDRVMAADKVANTKKEISQKALADKVQTISGDTISIEKVLQRTQDKTKIVNFWASWCAPCMYEIERARSFTNNLSENNIAVVYLSLDTDESSWRSTNSKLNGSFNSPYQYRFIEPDSARTLKELEINYVSKFVIIDKSGDVRINPAPVTSDSTSLKKILNRIE